MDRVKFQLCLPVSLLLRLIQSMLCMRFENKKKKLSSPSPIPNPSPKSRSQIQVPNPKSKVQRKRNGTGADNIILQATTTTTTPLTFLTWNVNLVMGKDHPWPSLTFFDLTWPSKFFYDLLRPPWPSMIKCQLSKPGLISGPLKPKPKLIKCLLTSPDLMLRHLHSSPAQIISPLNPRLDTIDSKSSHLVILHQWPDQGWE